MKVDIIDVMQEDIDGGTKMSANDCAIARAMMRIMRCAKATVAGHILTATMPDGEFRSWQVPPVMLNFQQAFDTGRTVRPSTFHIARKPANAVAA